MSLLSGILLALSFPTVLFGSKLPNLGFLAWVGLVPLLLTTYEATPRKAFCQGFLAATLCYLISYYWITVALHDYGQLSVVASLVTLLLLAMMMALYIGIACFLARWLAIKTQADFFILFPAVWTLLEWAKNYTPFGGFPWANLAMSQSNFIPFIQIADLTGVYGVIFLLVWFNGWLAEAIRKRQGKEVKLFIPKTIATVSLLILVLGYGFVRLHQLKKDSAKAPQLKIGLIQPNIPQNEKWETALRHKHQTIFQEAVQQLKDHVDLIVWPETSWLDTPWVETGTLSPKKFGLGEVASLTPYSLLGLSFFTVETNRERYFNSAALVTAQGEIAGKYHKVHLVPFGEYIPLRNIFRFLTPVAAIGDFARGVEAKPLVLGNYQIAPLICFEDIFPELSRRMVQQGAHLLVNQTNDAWYGFSSAAWQHLALAQFRAVETRRPMVRATNTGITAVIDPTGKIANAAPWFEQSVMVHRVPMLGQRTTYVRLGDWFVLGCLGLIIWQGLLCLKNSKNV